MRHPPPSGLSLVAPSPQSPGLINQVNHHRHHHHHGVSRPLPAGFRCTKRRPKQAGGSVTLRADWSLLAPPLLRFWPKRVVLHRRRGVGALVLTEEAHVLRRTDLSDPAFGAARLPTLAAPSACRPLPAIAYELFFLLSHRCRRSRRDRRGARVMAFVRFRVV